jgi:hypothetical protein
MNIIANPFFISINNNFKENIMDNNLIQEKRMSSRKDDCYSTLSIAKELGMSAIALNEYLRERGIQDKKGQTWQLNPPFDKQRLTEIRSFQFDEMHRHDQMVWTKRGRAFIMNLVQNGMSPIVALNYAIEYSEPMPSMQLSIFD